MIRLPGHWLEDLDENFSLVIATVDHRRHASCNLPIMSSPSDDFAVAVGVEALVCGAISNRSLSESLHMGLLVWSGVAGRAEKVVASLASTGDLSEELSMPRVAAPRYCRDLAWAGGEGPLIWGWRVGADRLAMMSQVG